MPGKLSLTSTTILFVAGCAHMEPVTSAQLDRGYILMLPGVANRASSMVAIAQGLRDAGVDQAIERDLWGDHPFGELKNVMALELNRKRAAERALRIAAYRRKHPDRPITLIGYSGGGAIAIFICEALPEDVRVDRVILLAAAVSPDYDLRPAIARCSQGVVNYYSPGDWFDAGVLTLAGGTMDRKHTSTAGRLGFRDGDGQPVTLKGLTQVAWTSAWRRLGHAGGHLGWDSRAWAREVLGPVVRRECQPPVARVARPGAAPPLRSRF